ncbi:MAG: electron transport complex subunit RsxC [Lachnospirales bacterium]
MNSNKLNNLGARISTFKKGIHPHDSKEHSKDEPIVTILPKEGQKLIFPVSQHIGAPCEPIVAVGDRVLLGQKIAQGSAFVSTSIHSSISGTVVEISPKLTIAGAMVNSIVIENDGKDETIDNYGVERDYSKFTKEEILDIVKENGIVGLGGAGFPTFIKLNPPPEQKIEYVIINAAECEPYLTTDYRVMLERPEELINGLEIILSLHKDAKGIIGIETNKPDAIEKINDLVKDNDKIEVIGLVPKYPQGSEKQLIQACTGRVVSSGALPSTVGCIVANVDTVASIYNAVAFNKPLTTRIVSWTGEGANKPGNYETRIGTMLNELFDELGGIKETTTKMIAGGPMMGMSIFTTEVPLIKTSSAFLFLTQNEGVTPCEYNCIRCGKCVSHCPIGLMPLELNYHAITRNFEEFENYNGLDCIECGSCSYVCPSKRHLAQTIRATKRTVMGMKRK